jgi:hypothetical protein
VPLKRLSTIILHGSISQKTNMNFVTSYLLYRIIRRKFLLDLHVNFRSDICCLYQAVIRSRVSSGSIVFDYELDDRGSIPGRGKGFFL